MRADIAAGRMRAGAAAPGMSLGAALAWAARRLEPVHESARLDAEVLLAHATGHPRHHPYAWPEAPLPEPVQARFEALVARRAAGEPVAYLTGCREFWSLALEAGPEALIPRPESELLVELALSHIPLDARWRIADLGTGSGALALAIARERAGCRVLATDISGAALALAHRNARRLRVGNVRLRRGEWCTPLGRERFALIVSNPPYVAEGDPHLARGDVRFEPRAALAGGPDGLAAVRRIAADARRHLRPGGWLLLEHAFDQGGAVRALLAALGYAEVRTHRDGAGHERVTRARHA